MNLIFDIYPYNLIFCICPSRVHIYRTNLRLLFDTFINIFHGHLPKFRHGFPHNPRQYSLIPKHFFTLGIILNLMFGDLNIFCNLCLQISNQLLYIITYFSVVGYPGEMPIEICYQRFQNVLISILHIIQQSIPDTIIIYQQFLHASAQP